MTELPEDAYREAGRDCERNGDLNGAKHYYYLALQENPADYNSIANLAWVEHKTGNTNVAKRLIEKVCDARPDKGRFNDLRDRIYRGILSLQ